MESVSRETSGSGRLELNARQWVIGIVFSEPAGRSLSRCAGRVIREVEPKCEFSPYLNVLPAGADVVTDYDRTVGQSDYLLLCLDTDLIRRAAGDPSELPDIDPFCGTVDPLCLQLAETLKLECRDGGHRGALFAEHAATLMFLHLLRSYSNLGPRLIGARTGGLAPYQLRRVQDHIEDRVTDELSLAELSALVDLSVHHFCRAFKKSTGLPPHRWQVRQRVKRAQAMMLAGDLSLADISVACGFSDQSHFTTVFRKLVGTTPNAWRRSMRT